MDEAAWIEADVASDFFMVLPMDTSMARVRTEVRMTYDRSKFVSHSDLFSSCYQVDISSNRCEEILPLVKMTISCCSWIPFDDQTNGFSFGANAAGAQWDGLMYEGGKVDLSWDNKWTSVVKKDDDKWVFEASIPFKTIRYKKGITKWGINFSRLDLKDNGKIKLGAGAAPISNGIPSLHRNLGLGSAAATGRIKYFHHSLCPWAVSSKNYEKETPTSYKKEIGVDAKIAVTSSLNLDLTINPDFSQVEVDRQVTNLDRFELFFPERRQFFLENGDLFANFGYATIRPFFSRRIGLGYANRIWRCASVESWIKIGELAYEYANRQSFRNSFASSEFCSVCLATKSFFAFKHRTDFHR